MVDAVVAPLWKETAGACEDEPERGFCPSGWNGVEERGCRPCVAGAVVAVAGGAEI